MKRIHRLITSICILGFSLFLMPAQDAVAQKDQIRARLAPALALSFQELQLALSITIRAEFDGALIVADDGEGTFLGKIGSTVASESIFNPVGRHGSTVASQSIWNEVGRYGGKVSRLSPFNPVTSSPPLIVKDGKVVGRLTVNEVLLDAVNPYLLKAFLK